ncbi:hypothetical protein [Jiella mangrovi]|uniref:Uncharacterized protein n=1 Tax=Jiella mangrovi TaxID=2821407 RepID=A0ABS4BDH1_9HYPH|nr:hypothetical protein [Jiella mangrovi]MBP0614783.1 hypothetical protein [Jiella mangrovi]
MTDQNAPLAPPSKRPDFPLALAGVAAIVAIAALGFVLWLDQGEALLVKLAASAWASCF